MHLCRLVFIDEIFDGFVTIKPQTGALAGECRELELIFIVKILSEYFDFLGYWLEPHRPLTPSQVSLTRLTDRSRQLLERTASIARLREYVLRWLQ